MGRSYPVEQGSLLFSYLQLYHYPLVRLHYKVRGGFSKKDDFFLFLLSLALSSSLIVDHVRKEHGKEPMAFFAWKKKKNDAVVVAVVLRPRDEMERLGHSIAALYHHLS